MKAPSSPYHPLIRSWDGILRSPEYDRREMDVRKVCPSGCIWLHQTEHYIGQTLTDEYVSLKHDVDGKLDVYYGPVYLDKLSRQGLVKPRMKTRRR